MRIFLILIALFFLSGCASGKLPGTDIKLIGTTEYEEIVCHVPAITFYIAGTKEASSHPSFADSNAIGISVPPMNKIWLGSRMYSTGVYPDKMVLGHEVQHIMSYHCPGIVADPDKFDYDEIF